MNPIPYTFKKQHAKSELTIQGSISSPLPSLDSLLSLLTQDILSSNLSNFYTPILTKLNQLYQLDSTKDILWKIQDVTDLKVFDDEPINLIYQNEVPSYSDENWSLAFALYGITTTKIDNLIYICFYSALLETTRIICFDIDLCTLYPVSNLKSVRMINHAASVVGDVIYYSVNDAFWGYDIYEDEWLELPNGFGTRCYHASVTIGECVYLIAGQGMVNDSWIFYNDVWEFDTISKTWEEIKISGMFSPRAAHSATHIGGNQILVFGGGNYDGFQYYNEIWIIDLNNKKCSIIDPPGWCLPEKVGGHSAILIDNLLYIVGGYRAKDPYNWCYSKHTFVLNLDTYTWEVRYEGILPPRGDFGACYVKEKDYIIMCGGITNDGPFAAMVQHRQFVFYHPSPPSLKELSSNILAENPNLIPDNLPPMIQNQITMSKRKIERPILSVLTVFQGCEK